MEEVGSAGRVQKENETQFLLHTYVLERMSGSLCDAVLETTGSASTLEALERTPSSCRSTGEGSGTATTTSSGSRAELARAP